MTPEQFVNLLARAKGGGVAVAMQRAGMLGAADTERTARERARTVLHVRTGYLRRSITSTSEWHEGHGITLTSRAGGVGTAKPVRYARLQEKGGTVRPVQSQYLRIPLWGGPALTAAGVDRYAGPLRQAAPPGFFRVMRTKSGKLLLVHDVGKGKNARVEAWYLLARQATIPARPYLYPSVVEAGQRLAVTMGAQLRAVLAPGATGSTP